MQVKSKYSFSFLGSGEFKVNFEEFSTHGTRTESVALACHRFMAVTTRRDQSYFLLYCRGSQHRGEVAVVSSSFPFRKTSFVGILWVFQCQSFLALAQIGLSTSLCYEVEINRIGE